MFVVGGAILALAPAFARNEKEEKAGAAYCCVPPAAIVPKMDAPAYTYKLDSPREPRVPRQSHRLFQLHRSFTTFDAELQLDPANPAARL
jgi:polyisoprenoid-binding protein YceI